MLVLIWSKEKSIVEELLRAYWKLYFDPKSLNPEKIAWNLINLFSNSNLTEKTSLEEILVVILDDTKQISENDKKNKEIFMINHSVFKFLWNIFLAGFQNLEKRNIEENDIKSKQDLANVRSSLEILRIAYHNKKDILDSKFDSFAVILASFLKNNVMLTIYFLEVKHLFRILIG